MAQPTILVRSSWQTVNIGDIAHTPGLLTVLETKLPEARVILWPRNISNGVREMLRRHIPAIEIAEGELDDHGLPSTPALKDAWERADLFLHGSGPAPLCAGDAAMWAVHTGKPFGFFGITAERPSPEEAEILNRADFILTRESLSLAHLESADVTKPITEFCPDATFSCDIRDDGTADAFLQETGLIPDTFFCVIPRLRYTPYYKIHRRDPSPEELRREAINSKHAEPDHAKLRGAIIRIVRELGSSVLVCPEMTYQLDIMDELLVASLPQDVRSRVAVRRRYWLTDEATSVYARSRGVISFECHSPILALRQGVPVTYLRQPTDTIKGHMWRDIGLSDWILEIEKVDGNQIFETIQRQQGDPTATRAKILGALDRADALFTRGTQYLRAAIPAPSPAQDL